ncbi:hypothetical protein [Streptomyces sp. NPDC002164]|uniref:hypothetical protein n=1 Tax=Streptomyces sp. NPDC002164 TaxID=3364633 RepID=UPI0036878448
MSTSDQDQAADARIAAPGAASDGAPEGETKRVRRAQAGPDGEPARSADGEPARSADGEPARSADGEPATGADTEDASDTPVATPETAVADGTSAESVADAADTGVAGTRGTGIADQARPDPVAQLGAGPEERRLTPRQARRLRIALSSVGMAAMAVVLALRIASRSSVLVVGVYGLALILCGIVIELSRNGRTRLGTWLLVVGLVAAIGSDWLLIP